MSAPQLKESALEQQASDYLELDGWRSLKTDPKHLRGLGVLEKGIADRLYIRYHAAPHEHNPPRRWAEVMWIEWKTPKGRTAPQQHAWREREQTRGALALIAGIDFEASLEGFIAWYEESGLQRRKVQLGGEKDSIRKD